jgi:hypothetical protein
LPKLSLSSLRILWRSICADLSGVSLQAFHHRRRFRASVNFVCYITPILNGMSQAASANSPIVLIYFS